MARERNRGHDYVVSTENLPATWSIGDQNAPAQRFGLARIRFHRWETVVSTLSMDDQAMLRLVVSVEAPARWQPHGRDLDRVIAVARGRIAMSDCVQLLRANWREEFGELPQETKTDAAAAGAEAVSTAASAGLAIRAQWLLDQAREARAVLVGRQIRRIPLAGGSGEWLKRVAKETLDKRGPTGTSGALGQFHGQLFEHLDAKTYNLRNIAKQRLLVLRSGSRTVSRFVDGRFDGPVVHKMSSGGVVRAAKKLDARRVGPGTLRVPKDQAAAASVRLGRTRVAGRMRVEASELSSSAVRRRGTAGLHQLSAHGGNAISSVHRFGRSAGMSAMTAAVIGAATDAGKLYRREISAEEFATLRGMDAAEHAAGHLVGVVAASGVVVGAGMVAGNATGLVAASAAAVAGGVGVAASAVPMAVTVAAGFAVSRAVRPLRRRAQAWAAERAHARVVARVAQSEAQIPGGPAVPELPAPLTPA